LMAGGAEAIVTVQEGRLTPIPFADIRDPETGKTRIRMVNIDSESYSVAREYMIRLESTDFDDLAWVEKLAEAGAMTADEFSNRFSAMNDRAPSKKEGK